ncbi:EscU/YscU/HrcU family type III secretion system export apparatus switch protein [Rhodobacter calidifons]|uniref:Flagellar biosynthesis protein FlhB n=1 Tax=Rhodobacter calidifons TaxID=2715277 RepID=A0ABX0G6Z4_9RHOB|nr:flagellar type III secretion system protein FlhB [Rhodobacter calidifons]NHB76650.1 flagellar biosynthesis protein FlhB [Rhodobacter calidifons]
MSGKEEDAAEKEHEASQQKLDQARKDGDIPKSVDLQTAAATGGFLLALFSFGGWAAHKAGTTGMVLLDQSDRLSSQITAGSKSIVGGMVLGFALPPLVLLSLAPALVIALLVASRGLVFAPKKLAPKLSRISPVATARQKFGVEGLVEFGKSAAKMVLVGLILYALLAGRMRDILASLYLSPAMSAALMARLVLEFLLILLAVQLAIGGIDYLWQVSQHRRRHRMSRKEMLDEFKESEGDPHLKSARRQRAQEVATNRMLVDVATADVVVVNPTHYAVALRWDRKKGNAPVCVAKGVDEIARKIRERAAEAGVPIHSDPPTARAIHASVEVGQEIRVEHYRAIAAAIRFADAMRRKAGRR